MEINNLLRQWWKYVRTVPVLDNMWTIDQEKLYVSLNIGGNKIFICYEKNEQWDSKIIAMDSLDLMTTSAILDKKLDIKNYIDKNYFYAYLELAEKIIDKIPNESLVFEGKNLYKISGNTINYPPGGLRSIENSQLIDLGNNRIIATTSFIKDNFEKFFGLTVIKSDGTAKDYYQSEYNLSNPQYNQLTDTLVCVLSNRPNGSNVPLNYKLGILDSYNFEIYKIVDDGLNGWPMPMECNSDDYLCCYVKYYLQMSCVYVINKKYESVCIYKTSNNIEKATYYNNNLFLIESNNYDPLIIKLFNCDLNTETIIDSFESPYHFVKHRKEIFEVKKPKIHKVGLKIFEPSSHPGKGTIFLFHGGPTMNWNGWSSRWNPILYSLMGFQVIQVDPAASPGYGYSSLEVGWKSWSNIKTSASEAIKDYYTEETGLKIFAGGSFGGYLSLGVAQNLTPDIVIAHCAPVCPSMIYEVSESSWSWMREWGETSPEIDDLIFADLPSDSKYLISHGLKDTIVPFTVSVRLYKYLHATGKKVSFNLLGNSGHSISHYNYREYWEKWIAEEIFNEK